jgi:succinyl-CoA synthetase beta subunit
MNLHEFQGKLLLKKFGVPVPEGIVAMTPADALQAAKEIQKNIAVNSFAVKAQIHAGGRGKGGGVKIANSFEDVELYSKQILGMNLVTHQTGPEGKKVLKILIEQSIYYPNKEGKIDIAEYYMAVLLNRASGKNIIMYSSQGGMDIEKVAAETPHLIHTEQIEPSVGLLPFQSRKIAFTLGLSGVANKNMVKFIPSLYQAYLQSDATMLEINPVFKTSDDLILAADCKVNLDDNSLFRQREFAEMRDLNEENPSEIEASQFNLNFIKLSGNVGCMVNGAGLAMATMDIIKQSGGFPANFLDVGGGANAEKVEAGFRIILQDSHVKIILVNIFGGIVRCDRVAQGVVDAYKKIGDIKIPIIVRLQGTNAKEGKELIDNSGLKVHSAITLQEAADLVKKLV